MSMSFCGGLTVGSVNNIYKPQIPARRFGRALHQRKKRPILVNASVLLSDSKATTKQQLNFLKISQRIV